MRYVIGLGADGSMEIVKVWAGKTPGEATKDRGLRLYDGQIFDSRAEIQKYIDNLKKLKNHAAIQKYLDEGPAPTPSIPVAINDSDVTDTGENRLSMTSMSMETMLDLALVEEVGRLDLAPNRILRVAINDFGSGYVVTIRSLVDPKVSSALLTWCALTKEQLAELQLLLKKAADRIDELGRLSNPDGW